MILLLTGLMASGKSTVAELLAERLTRSVHLRGDVFRKMICSGREEMSSTPSEEALRQLHLRYRLAASAAKLYDLAGFTVVLQDNYYGEALPLMLSLLQPHAVQTAVLCPDAQAIARREAARGKDGYTGFQVNALYAEFMRTTPRIGLWLNNSGQTPAETVQALLDQLDFPPDSL